MKRGWQMALLLLLAISTSAQARQRSEEEAVARHVRGMALYHDAHWQAALDEFQKAYRLKPDPAFLFNAAQCQRQLAQRREAALNYRAYLTATNDASEAQRALVTALIAQMDTAVEARPPTPPPAPAPVVAPVAAVAVTPPAPLARPLHKRWWLWTAVGAGVVVAVGIGVGAGLGAAHSSSSPRSSTDLGTFHF